MNHKLYQVLRRLENMKVPLTLRRDRPDSIMICCSLVGARLEVDVFEDDHIEYSVFNGDEAVLDKEEELFKLVEYLQKYPK